MKANLRCFQTWKARKFITKPTNLLRNANRSLLGYNERTLESNLNPKEEIKSTNKSKYTSKYKG